MLGASAKGVKAMCQGCRYAVDGKPATCPLAGKVAPSWGVGCDGWTDGGTPAPAPAQDTPRRRVPTKTEAAYASACLAGKAARYEALTFHLANGHRYTPDWTWWEGGVLHAVEVKGSYKLGSYQRARLAFDQARLEFLAVRWTWAERLKDGTWRIKV